MSFKIITIKEANLSTLSIPKHPCMPDISNARQETLLAVDNNQLRAVCSLWTKHTPSFKNYKTGVIGNFFAEEDEAGISLLDDASERLRKQGFDYVVGPINGDIWHSYRLVTDAGQYPPFFMEYYTPETWPKMFSSSGFEAIAGYHSARAANINYEDNFAKKFAAKKSQLGLTVRSFNVTKATDELTAIHALSLQSFSKNFLYTDISLPEFLNLYEKMIPYVDPDFFLLVEHQEELVGFIFALPDYLQQQRNEEVDTVIIKTVAKLPSRTYAGLGYYLWHKIHRQANIKGFKHVIHALMHENNSSLAISNQSGQTIRNYTLYGKRLAS